MVDARDIAEIAALHLLRREQASGPLPRETLSLVGPDALTGAAIAGIWSKVLNRPVRYGGDDVAAFEERLRVFAPSWMAYDMRLMMSRYQRQGTVANSDDAGRLTTLLGRPLRSYRDFAIETAQGWNAP